MHRKHSYFREIIRQGSRRCKYFQVGIQGGGLDFNERLSKLGVQKQPSKNYWQKSYEVCFCIVNFCLIGCGRILGVIWSATDYFFARTKVVSDTRLKHLGLILS